MQLCDLPRPLPRDVRPCYRVHNELKNMKIFEAAEFIPKGAMAKHSHSGVKIELEMLYFDGTRQNKLAGLKSKKPRGSAREKYHLYHNFISIQGGTSTIQFYEYQYYSAPILFA